MADYETITTSVADYVMEITLNQPDTFNAVSETMHEELIHAFRSIAGNRDVRSVVLASTGKHFSAGGDLNAVFRMQTDTKLRQLWHEHGIKILYSLFDVPVPVIVALQGDAHGMGANLVLSCDSVVAARRARLSDTHVVAGMVAGDGGCVAWPQSMGMMWAKRHLLTGDFMSAEVAFQRGLVTDLVDTPEEALPAARALAARIAALPPIAVQGTKKSLNKILKMRAEEVFDYSMALEQISLTSSDIVEAVTAFKEKRKPVYKGE